MLNSRNITRSHLRPLRDEFLPLVKSSTAGQALQKLIDDYQFNTVLDVGSGQGLHAQILANHGKKVTTVDFGTSMYFQKSESNSDIDSFFGNFFDFPEEQEYECIWCSHTLEHQLNVNLFLTKMKRLLRQNGVLAITVPPLKHDVVGGHLSLWNAGTLMYNLVMAGFDCSKAAILQYGYNISIIVTKNEITLPDTLTYDRGDLELLADFFPPFVQQGFDGDIYEYNWHRN